MQLTETEKSILDYFEKNLPLSVHTHLNDLSSALYTSNATIVRFCQKLGEYMETLPNDKTRQAHLKRMEKELFAQYKPELKKLSFSQGKLLIKLIDRECNQSSYNLLKAYLGSFRAGFWNFFAGMFGASLKSEYDPKGKDAMTERVVVLVENGLI